MQRAKQAYYPILTVFIVHQAQPNSLQKGFFSLMLLRIMRINIIIFSITILMLSACNTVPTIVIEIEQACMEEFQNLITTVPPPFKYKILDTLSGESGGGIRIQLKKLSWTQETLPEKAHTLQKILKCTCFAPVAQIWDHMDSADQQDLANGIAVVPLESIILPGKALAYEGLYPSDPAYKLKEKVILSVSPQKGGTIPDPVLAWYQSIYSEGSSPQVVWVGAVGDVMPGEGAETTFLSGQGIRGVFTDTLPLLQSYDLLAGNLEAAATTYTVKTPKAFNYQFNPVIIPLLKKAGFDYMALANNHCYDYGETGFKDTLAYLEQYQLPTSGAGVSAETAAAPWRTIINHQQFSFLSLGAYPGEWNGFDGLAHASVTPDRAGILWADETGLKALAAGCTKEGFDVIMVHGGRERTLVPTGEQQALYRQFVDLGADLVIGSHPHAIQGMEVYRNKLIAYSLGNFIFPDEIIYKYATVSVILAVGIIEQQVKYLKIHSINMKGAYAELDPEQKGLKRILELTRELNKAVVRQQKHAEGYARITGGL